MAALVLCMGSASLMLTYPCLLLARKWRGILGYIPWDCAAATALCAGIGVFLIAVGTFLATGLVTQF